MHEEHHRDGMGNGPASQPPRCRNCHTLAAPRSDGCPGCGDTWAQQAAAVRREMADARQKHSATIRQPKALAGRESGGFVSALWRFLTRNPAV